MTGLLMEHTSSRDPAMGSDRSFGLVFAAFFAVVALLPLVHGHAARVWAFGPAALFLAVAMTRPQWLRPLNRVWFRFGLILHRIVSPIILGLMFFVAVTPFALIMRMLGKRPLPLTFDPAAASYWIQRDPPGPEAGSMHHQF